jgi:predicted outer membrane repeat protein
MDKMVYVKAVIIFILPVLFAACSLEGDIETLRQKNKRSPGLYLGNEKIGNQNLSEALSYISSNAVSGDDFYIVLGANESASPMNLNYSGKTVGITLLGSGGERTITLLNSSGSLFIIRTGVTLTLDKNITLYGGNTDFTALVLLDSGNLIINNGTKITGNTNISSVCVRVNRGTVIMNGGTINGNTSESSGGGVYVDLNGTFIMNGGTINGNTSNSGGGIYSSGSFTMYGGVISGNTSENNGGGVYVYVNGTFTMYGGVISGNTSESSGGGVYSSGTFTMHGGVISGNTSKNNGGGVCSSDSFKKLPSGSGQNSGIIYGSEAVGNDANGRQLKNTAINNNGHAVYRAPIRMRNTTAGQTDQIDTTTVRGLSANGYAPFEQ